jgi:hypothetical protein
MASLSGSGPLASLRVSKLSFSSIHDSFRGSLTVLLAQLGLEVGEGIVSSDVVLLTRRTAGSDTLEKLLVLLMLVIVAVEAEVLPVAAVWRVVVVIVILVMHCELVKVFQSELAAATAAHPWMDA